MNMDMKEFEQKKAYIIECIDADMYNCAKFAIDEMIDYMDEMDDVLEANIRARKELAYQISRSKDEL